VVSRPGYQRMMMKKIAFVPLLLLTAAAWGIEWVPTLGAGAFVGTFMSRYSLEGRGGVLSQNADQSNYGLFAYVDASTYGEIVLSLQQGTSRYSNTLDDNFSLGEGQDRDTRVGISVMGKYPFHLSDSFSWFPLLGVEYQLTMSQTAADRSRDKDGKRLPLSAWNALWINAGVGVDFYLTTRFYLRGELLYGLRLMTDYERDGLEQAKELLRDDNPTMKGLTSGPVLRCAVGYRLGAGRHSRRDAAAPGSDDAPEAPPAAPED